MRRKSETRKAPAGQVIKDIKRRTRRAHGPKENMRIVLKGLRGGQHRRVVPSRAHQPKPLLSLVEGLPRAGTRRLAVDCASEATSGDVTNLRQEAVAALTLENQLQKSMIADGGDEE